jgi:hypothetical protein
LPPSPGRASRRRLLLAPRAHVWLTLAALVLCAPALGAGMVLDDHVLRVLARGEDGLAGARANPLFLFTFTNGRPADNLALMDKGALLPWYGDPLHRNAFLRPLSSLTHLLDFALDADAAWLMHLHSLAWFAVLLFVVAHVYRVLAGGLAVAALAFALFALDDAHGMTVTWIANRNALISAALALPALSAHHRWLAHGWRPGAWLGPLCFALGLCAGETAVAVFGYVLAYALALDRAPLWQRARHALPYLLLLGLWRTVWAAFDLGSFGSGAYHDPGQEPLGYALALVKHLPVLLSAQLALPFADNWFWGPPDGQLAIWLISAACTLGFAAVGHALLRHDAEARFWMIGMVLSACAVAASIPGERLLLVPGVGGAVVIAKLLAALRRYARGLAEVEPNPPRSKRVIARSLMGALVLLHLVVAPLLLPIRALGMGVLRSALDRAEASLPGAPEIAQRTVIVLDAPFDLMCSYVQPSRQARGLPRPAHVHWLAVASSPLELRVLDAHALEVRPARGFLLTGPEQHYRGDPSGLPAGARVELTEMRVEVLDVSADRRPASARFTFREPLSSPRYLFVRYQDGRFVPWQPPPPGTTLQLPQADFFPTMAAEWERMQAR